LSIIAYLYFYHPTAHEAGYVFVERGEIVLRVQGDALVIRSEEIHELPKHGRAEFSVIEGEMLNQGESLATLLTPGFDEQLLYEFQEVQERIFAYQRENIVNYVLDSDVLELQSSINETITDIQANVIDGRQYYLEGKEKDLRSLLTKRQEILDKTVVPDIYLRELYEQEAEIKKQLSASMIEIMVPASGIVSFSSDGLEDVLNPEAVALVTIDDIYALIRQRRTLVNSHSEDRIPFIRLIDPSKWFIACIITEPNVFLNAGDEIELRFLENYERTFSGIVHKTSRGSKASLIVIELTDDIQAVISTRSATIEIGKKKDGLMVPLSALLNQNGIYGLRVAHGSSYLFAPVDVLAFGDKYAIIEDVEDATDVDINTRVMLE
jgi:putative membrane fusion protein